ncbi:sporulation protein Cse60 [Paenibacillus nanensis]|uniref:Sporulation protein Cse60 n=1 Tax=Paenibacillus nanensis TaxID=393251 RepID=A0A3A1VF48_9BACL|nr:sporulation protein Cse60 [Paenibacillus nanensis]RIX59539.1 sporulation protein Cse60 [Paenibacillus nanensis]
MIQVKEFVDSDRTLAVDESNKFLAGLPDDAIIDVKYSANYKKLSNGQETQRSAILVVYKVNK